MNNELMFSSDNMEWETPPWLVKAVEEQLVGQPFTLDACAKTAKVSKAPSFYSPKEDALNQAWEGIVWMNPPYGRTIIKWTDKAYTEAVVGATVACLLPARTDTRFFHDVCVKGNVYLIKGRILFEIDGKPITDKKGRPTSAPFPSMVAVLGGPNAKKPSIKPWVVKP